MASEPAEPATHQRAAPQPAAPAYSHIKSSPSTITSSRPAASAGLPVRLDLKGKLEEPNSATYVRVFVYEHTSRKTDILEIHLSTGRVHREDIRSLINPFEEGSCLTIRRKGLDGFVKAIKIRLVNIQAVVKAKKELLERAKFRLTSSAPRYPDLMFEGTEFGVIDVSSLLPVEDQPADGQPAMVVAQPSMAATASEQVAKTEEPARLPGPKTEKLNESAFRVGLDLEKFHESRRLVDLDSVTTEKASLLVDLGPEASEEPTPMIDLGIEDSENIPVSALTELLALVAPSLEEQPLVDLNPEDTPAEPQPPLAPPLSSFSDLEGIKF